jgi:hypothetical protein
MIHDLLSFPANFCLVAARLSDDFFKSVFHGEDWAGDFVDSCYLCRFLSG